jgi:Transposase DDE domain
MDGYAKDLLANLSSQGQTLVLMLDQSHINAHNEVLMASVRVGERALPLHWLVKECQGSMGFEEQKELLEQLPALLPQNFKVLLTADRFYGTGAVIDWCQKHGFDYRIRLKGNARISVEGVSMSVEEAFKRFPAGCSRVEMTATGIFTAIGFLHEEGHEEPWFIAMKEQPSEMRVRDYGLRWGIEAMFSDFKSRGFGIMQSQIQKERRLSMLIFVMTIAMYYAVSNGEKQKKHEEALKKS